MILDADIAFSVDLVYRKLCFKLAAVNTHKSFSESALASIICSAHISHELCALLYTSPGEST